MDSPHTAEEVYDPSPLDPDVLGYAKENPEDPFQPWIPMTLDDLEFSIGVLKERDLEIRLLEDKRREQIGRINQGIDDQVKSVQGRRDRFLRRYLVPLQELTESLLPRREDGSPRAKHVKTMNGRAVIKTSASKPEVVDDDRLIDALINDPNLLDLTDALRVERKEQRHGLQAVEVMKEGAEGWKATLLRAPVAEFVRQLPETVDPETGEAQPACIPGVRWSEARDEWAYE